MIEQAIWWNMNSTMPKNYLWIYLYIVWLYDYMTMLVVSRCFLFIIFIFYLLLTWAVNHATSCMAFAKTCFLPDSFYVAHDCLLILICTPSLILSDVWGSALVPNLMMLFDASCDILRSANLNKWCCVAWQARQKWLQDCG